ncbi:MAG: ABC transporter ATP-binding protein/permease [Verrucomicrobia bacterium]|nr:ABC transporter ATP-binding protein/permease [Verrucomicrobiota bacterium]
MKNTLLLCRELASFLRPYRAVYLLGAMCGICFGVLSGSIPLLINFVGKTVFSSVAGATFPQGGGNGRIMDRIIAFVATDLLHLDHVSRNFLVIFACLLIPSVMLLRSLLDFLNGYCSEWTSQKVLIDIRSRLLENITAQSVDYFNHAKAGNLFQKVINETREVQGILTLLGTNLISQPATLVSGLVVLFRLDWKFTMGALILLPCCISPMFYLTKKIRREARDEEAGRGELAVILHEIISGIKVVKAFSRTRYELDRFDASGRSQFRQIMKARRIMEITSPLAESLAALGISIGLLYVYTAGMSGTTFLSLCFGIFLLYNPLRTLSKLQLTLARSEAVMQGVLGMMREIPSIVDARDAITLRRCNGEIELKGISFGYRSGVPVLRDLNLNFERGKHYALVGVSGAGKSTIFSLIMRFYDPEQGSVSIDGRDIREFNQNSLRDQIGIVAQDTFLFHDSIHNNIAYGRPGATREEVVLAARKAHAHDFILAQKNGYETVVGDNGCMLSGGQQQRISIARALLKNPPVLLMDEATSSLDSASETQIQLALDELVKGKTVIAIAHRLSTIQRAERIILIDGGGVRAEGTHVELLASSATYRTLHKLQFHE